MLKCYTVGMTHWDNEVTAEDALGYAWNALGCDDSAPAWCMH